MSVSIDYYYFGASPFTYLGHQAITDVAAKHGIRLVHKPVNLFALWEISGAVPPGQRPPVRQRYRILELQRIAEMRGLPINLQPAHFPVDTTLADCCTIAISEKGSDPSAYMMSVFKGVWADDANLSDEAEIHQRLTDSGFDADAVLESAKSKAITDIRDANTQEAIERDAVGVPAYVLNGEVFWGQDRIEFINRALETRRQPFGQQQA